MPDPRLAALAAIARPERVLPAVVEFVDIAGLVAGASKGEGLGNQFLANIRETDAIAHVVRCFEDPNVVHVAGKIDPVSDIETINTELALADLAAVDKQMSRYAKAARAGGDKEAKRLVAALEKIVPALNDARPARSVDLYPEELAVLKPLFLLTMKPTMYVANVSEHGFAGNPLLDRVEAYARARRRAGGRDQRRARSADRRSRRRRQADLPRRHGPGRSRARPLDPRRLRVARVWRPISPPGRRKSAPGRYGAAAPRRRPRA